MTHICILFALVSIAPVFAARIKLAKDDVQRDYTFDDTSATKILLIGGSGAGKSNLGNYLSCQSELFETGDDQTSVTTKTQISQVPFFSNYDKGLATIVDTPGLMDTGGKDVDKKQWDAVVKDLTEKVVNAHAVLLVLNGQRRMSREVRETITQFRTMFGKEFWRVVRVVVTRVPWNATKQAEETETRRKIFFQIEEGVVGQNDVDEKTQHYISQLKFYGIDMLDSLTDEQDREDALYEKDCDELDGYSLAQLIELDTVLQQKYKEQEVGSFKEWKKKNKKLKKELDPDLYQWGVGFGNLNLGRLEELRQDVQSTKEPLKLAVTKMKGKTRTVIISVETRDGFNLGLTPFELAKESTIQQVMEQAVFVVKLVRDLTRMPKPEGSGSKAKGWLAKDVTLVRGELSLMTDSQLRQAAKKILKLPPDEEPKIVALVEWSYNSPPQILGPELTRKCIEVGDIGAIEALVKDHVTDPEQLAFISDLSKTMPHTQKHGRVFEKVKEIRDQKRKELAEKPSNQIEKQRRKTERDAALKEIEDVRKQLEPYLEEVKSEVEDRALEAEEMRLAVKGKVQNLLEEVNFKGKITVPRKIPEMATSADLLAFVSQIDTDMKAAYDNADGEVLGAEELIWNSRVLKGIYLGLEPEPKAQDMVQIIKAPDLDVILSPAEQTISFEDSTFQSQSVTRWSKRVTEKVGESFASSSSASGVMISSYGVGAFHMACKVSGAEESRKEQEEKGLSQSTSFHMLRNHNHPKQLLELDHGLLRLTPPVVSGIVQILTLDRKQWPNEIFSLFNFFGTHYCPSVELGGIWTQEAHFTESKTYEETELTTAISKCFDFEMKGGGALFGSIGFGSLSSGGSKHSCKANSTGEASEQQEVMKSTIISRRCMSNAKNCPANDQAFVASLATNGNWAVIDRKMSKCVSLWDALRGRDAEEVRNALAEKIGDKSRSAFLIQQFRETANRVWHLRVLNLPRLCKTLKLDSDTLEKCDEFAETADAGADKINTISLHTIADLWDSLSKKIKDDAKTTETCAKLNFCNNHNNQGSCMWKDVEGTTSRTMVCTCNPYWTGDKCQDKIPKKSCEDKKKNSCTIHPIDWYQDDCDIHGSDYVYDEWEYCAGFLAGKYICKKTWECQPPTVGANCCGSSFDGGGGAGGSW